MSSFKENQFQLKMMELKDTFSWEILHPSCFLFQSLFLCRRQTQFPSHFLFSLWISPQIAMETFPTSEDWRQQWGLLTKNALRFKSTDFRMFRTFFQGWLYKHWRLLSCVQSHITGKAWINKTPSSSASRRQKPFDTLQLGGILMAQGNKQASETREERLNPNWLFTL